MSASIKTSTLAQRSNWIAVLWVAPSTPSSAPAQPPLRVAARDGTAVPEGGALRAVVRSGLAAPGGGRFDRFDVRGQPVLAPVNAHGQVAFYATVLHAPVGAVAGPLYRLACTAAVVSVPSCDTLRTSPWLP